MHIQFSCVGGMANLDLNVVIDTDELPQAKRDQLQHLMETADLSNLSLGRMIEAKAKATGADAFSYKLDILEETEKQSFTFTDTTASGKVRPLLDYLRNLAIEVKLAE
ncbi:protealysin inhibitor emfourin [Peribacillus muralis]|uniref:protealysin inhibitor emfourin n=1 Tax=Peribacillus muralis TaxID=264697 RepID=UPI00366C2140